MLRDTPTDALAPAPDAGVTSSWVIDAAARHARHQGVGVRVVLPRAPGVVATVRAVAQAHDVKVTTTIAPTSITARFDVRATIDGPTSGSVVPV